MDWCKSEPLGVVIVPPFTNAPGSRSKASLIMVLDQFPLDAERYRSRDVTGDLHPETFCNFFTRDVSRAMGSPLPEGKTANMIHADLNAGKLDYHKVSATDAALALERGEFVIAIAANPHGAGHMTPCREVVNGTIYCDHVGKHNARRIPVTVAFGPFASVVEFWLSNK